MILRLRGSCALLILGMLVIAPPVPAQVQIVEIDPAEIDLRQLEQDIFQATNTARQTPEVFSADIVQKIQGTYVTMSFEKSHHLLVTLPGESTMGFLVASESDPYMQDVDGAIHFLMTRRRPLPALNWSRGLALAARDHAMDPRIAGHKGGDGSTSFQRMSRYGSGGRAENLGSNHTTGFGFVSSFIIDHRVPSRGHRTNIFDSAYTDVGVGCHYFAPADAQRLGYIRCVMNFGEGWTDNANLAAAGAR